MVPGRTVEIVPSNSIGCSALTQGNYETARRRIFASAHASNFELIPRILTPWSAPAIAATTTTTTTFFFGTCFVHGQITTSDILSGETGNGCLRPFRRRHGDECESARAAAHSVHNKIDLCDRAVRGKHVLQVVFCRVEGKIPDV